jgi:hypothetical protein
VLGGRGAVGDVLIVAIPGGHMALDSTLSIESGKLQGSLRPKPGEPGTLVVSEAYPRFQVGRPEVLFLRAAPGRAGEFVIAALEGRYVVEAGGKLASPIPAIVQDAPVRAEVEGLGVANLGARLRRGQP